MKGGRAVFLGLAFVAFAGIAAWLLLRDGRDERRTLQGEAPAIAAPIGAPLLPLPLRDEPRVETLAVQPVVDASSRGGLIVHAVDAAGAPLEGIRVSARQLPEKEGTSFVATTGADGAGRLPCAAGVYDVGAEDVRPDGNCGPSWIESVDVDAVGPTEVTLVMREPSGRVVAFVHDDLGTPIAGVEIDGNGLAPDRARGKRSTDEHGVAVWEPVVAGPWELRIESVSPKSGLVNPGHLRAEVVVDRGQTARHEFTLQRQGHVIVRLADVPQAVHLLNLTLHGERGRETQSVKTTLESAIRAIEFTWHLAPGEYVLASEWRPDSPWWSRPQRVQVEPGQITFPRIEAFDSTVRVSGRVRDSAGLPVGGVDVRIVVWADELDNEWPANRLAVLTEKTALSADDGRWSLDVPAGTAYAYANSYTALGRYLARYDGAIPVTDRARPIEITVSPGWIVTGRVEGAWAEQAAEGDLDVSIVHEQAPDPWRGGRTKRLTVDGNFEFVHASAGSYTAVLKRGGQVVTDTLRFEVPTAFEEGATIAVTLDFPGPGP